MNYQERSYGGKLFRPRPEIHTSENSSLFIIATPWGDPQVATDFISTVTTQFRTSTDDIDQKLATIHIEGLNFNETLLRKSIFKAHDEILEKYNDQVLTAAVEAICFLKSGPNLTWFKVGAPFFCLVRDKNVLPFNHPVDFSFDYSCNTNTDASPSHENGFTAHPLAPLPKALIGTQEQVQLESGSLRLAEGDQFLFVSRSYIPVSFFQSVTKSLSLDNATLALAKDQEELPFWIASGNYT